jgi:hypothetical protein
MVNYNRDLNKKPHRIGGLQKSLYVRGYGAFSL